MREDLTPLSLVYDEEVKPHLLNYLYATFLLSEANVDCKALRTLLNQTNAFF